MSRSTNSVTSCENEFDELHKKRFNKTPFFLHDETMSENTITRAEQKLGELSNVNLELIRRTSRPLCRTRSPAQHPGCK